MFEIFPGWNSSGNMTQLAMKNPMHYLAAPHVMDLNYDGIPDLVHHNHYSFSSATSRWSDPSVRKRGPRGGCTVDWDFLLRDDKIGGWKAPKFLDWTDYKTGNWCFDAHSLAFLDLDNDGLNDLFVVTGGGRGGGNSYKFDHLVFWARKNKSKLGYVLEGGREAALKAGLQGRTNLGNDRGRHLYFFDGTGNGRLDAVLLNDERKDNNVVPSQVHKNKGKRKFNRLNPNGKNFAEFAQIAILTDLNGDGHARELIVPSTCMNGSKNYVCNRAPRGSISVYKFDSKSVLLRETTAPPLQYGAHYQDIATGDFDFDGKPDVAIALGKRIYFFLSKTRQARCGKLKSKKQNNHCLMTLSSPDVTLKACPNTSVQALRLADFNLDGMLDMLVVCGLPGTHEMWTLSSNGTWRVLTKDLGALNWKHTMNGGKDFCKGIPVVKLKNGSDKCRDYFSLKTCNSFRYHRQFYYCSKATVSYQGNPAFTFGATVSDLDNDGAVDVILAHRYGTPVMLRNKSSGRYVAVRLDRVAGQANSIGAIVHVTATNMGPSGNKRTTQMRVLSSLSHDTHHGNGSAENRLIFGLGDYGLLEKITVQWPHCCDTSTRVFKAKQAGVYLNKIIEMDTPKPCKKSCLYE